MPKRKSKTRYLPPKQLPDSWKKKGSNRVRNGLKRGVLIFSSFGFITSGLLLLIKREKIPDLIGLDSVNTSVLAMLMCIFMTVLFAVLLGGVLDKDKDGNWTHKGDASGWKSSGG